MDWPALSFDWAPFQKLSGAIERQHNISSPPFQAVEERISKYHFIILTDGRRFHSLSVPSFTHQVDYPLPHLYRPSGYARHSAAVIMSGSVTAQGNPGGHKLSPTKDSH